MEQKKTKPKFDRWFLVLLAIMMWELATQLYGLCLQLPSNWDNFNLWCRVIASGLATYGVVWVFRIYTGSIIKQNKKMKQLEEALKDHPEIRKIVSEILRG